MGLSELSVHSFFELLGSDAAAPGGGAAAALAGSLGSSLAEMVFALTSFRKPYAQFQEETEAGMAHCAALRTAFLAAMERDAEVFHGFSAALKLPKQTDREKDIRSVAIQDALNACIESPLHMMELSYEAIRLVMNMPGKTNFSAASDLGVAALMLGAAVQSAWLNVRINLSMLKDREKAAAYRARGEDLLKRTLDISNAVYEQILSEL